MSNETIFQSVSGLRLLHPIIYQFLKIQDCIIFLVILNLKLFWNSKGPQNVDTGEPKLSDSNLYMFSQDELTKRFSAVHCFHSGHSANIC